jgi:hypothetical protein
VRIWAEVYDASGNKLGNSQINDIIATKVKRELDAAGSFDFTVATSQQALDLLRNEREVRVFFKRDEEGARELYRGYIRQNRMSVGKSPDISISGVTKMDALARRSVLLGRAYDAKTISYIANDLIDLVPGWAVEVDSAIASDLQTSRFDGSSVLKALIRTAEEKGVHIREGLASNTVEMGAFGQESGLRFIKPPSSVGVELAQTNEVVLVGKITQTENTSDVVNWIIPIGAGEGSAALTLKNSTRTTPYTIRTMTAPNGQTLYYLSDSASILDYGQIERVITFKEIAPIANSNAAKIAAANALYDAATAWLQRNSVKLTSYKLSGCKVAQTIRPGDKIRIQFRGEVDTFDGKLTYIDIDDVFWVMGVTESFSKSGLSIDLDVTTIDRHTQDIKRIVVGMLDAIDVRNLSVQTFPWRFQDSKTRPIQATASPPSNSDHDAVYLFTPDSTVTDIIAVFLTFEALPLNAFTQPSGSFTTYFYDVYKGYNYPSYVHLWVNGVDVSTSYGGPWNNAGENATFNVTCDISRLITEASGGIYQSHSIELRAGNRTGEVRLSTAFPTQTGNASQGLIEFTVLALGTARATLAAPS